MRYNFTAIFATAFSVKAPESATYSNDFRLSCYRTITVHSNSVQTAGLKIVCS